jgi:hypothetical protein
MFERGIDPDVDNPSNATHSPIPDTWPPVEEILDFQGGRVRDRLAALYKANAADTEQKSRAGSLPCIRGK